MAIVFPDLDQCFEFPYRWLCDSDSYKPLPITTNPWKFCSGRGRDSRVPGDSGLPGKPLLNGISRSSRHRRCSSSRVVLVDMHVLQNA